MNNSKKDINLKEAVRRHEQKLPPMPADLNERLLKRLEEPPVVPKQRRLWPWIGAVAASIILLIAFNYNNKVMPEQQPIVAGVVEQPAPEAPKDSEYSDYFEYSDSFDKSEPIKPTKPTTPQSEPVLAQADQQSTESDAVRLTNTADSLAYYLTRLEKQMGDCRDSSCLAQLSELIRADDRIKTLVNKIIHKQVETAYQEEYLVDTTIHYIPL
jgi:hypothetical protein